MIVSPMETVLQLRVKMMILKSMGMSIRSIEYYYMLLRYTNIFYFYCIYHTEPINSDQQSGYNRYVPDIDNQTDNQTPRIDDPLRFYD